MATETRTLAPRCRPRAHSGRRLHPPRRPFTAATPLPAAALGPSPVPVTSFLTCRSPHDALLCVRGPRGSSGHDRHGHAEREGASRGAHGGGGGYGVLRRRARACCPPWPGCGTGGRRAPLGSLQEEAGGSLRERAGLAGSAAAVAGPAPRSLRPPAAPPAAAAQGARAAWRRPPPPAAVPPSSPFPPWLLLSPPRAAAAANFPEREARAPAGSRRTDRSGSEPAARSGPAARPPGPLHACPAPAHRPGGRRRPTRCV